MRHDWSLNNCSADLESLITSSNAMPHALKNKQTIPITKPPSLLEKCIFPSLIFCSILCFAFLFWSISTKTSILTANLSLGAMLSLFGTAIAYGTYYNYRYVGYMHQTKRSLLGTSRRTFRKESMQYSIVAFVAFMIGLGIFLLGSAFIVSSLLFKHHILSES